MTNETRQTRQEQIQRERREFKDRLIEELSEIHSRYTQYNNTFKNSLSFLAVPTFLAGFSYLVQNSEPRELSSLATDLTRQMASWTYRAISPFIVINGMRMAKEKGAYKILRKTYHEFINPGSGNIGYRGEEKK